jgi:uncharacterized membrane protein
MQIVQYIIIGLILVAAIGLIIINATTERKNTQVENETSGWKWGIIYYNARDKRIILPNRIGLGITFNFAHPISILITVGIFIFILLNLIVALS